MPKLNQIVAVVAGQKGRTQAAVTDAYKRLQVDAIFQGMSRTYQPRDDEGEMMPPESKRVQYRVGDAVSEAVPAWSQLMDAVLTQDAGNCEAAAALVVDGEEVTDLLPVTTLLFVEKMLIDVAAFVSKMPTLDPAFEWEYDKDADCYATNPIQTTRTKKIPRNHVKAEATDRHPAQVDVYHEDVVVGYWTKRDFSGAIPLAEKRAIQERIRKLQDAVKTAREAANSIDVGQRATAAELFGFIFPG